MCLGVEHGGIAVALDEPVCDGAFGQSAHFGEHLAGRVGIQVGIVAFAECFVDAQYSNRLNTWSRTLLL